MEALFRKIGRVNAGVNFDAKIDKLFHRADLQIFRKRSKHARLAFDQNHPRLRRIDVAEIFRQRVARDLGDRARHFDASRSTTNNHKRHRCLTASFVRNFLGVFERHQNAAPNFYRVFQTF